MADIRAFERHDVPAVAGLLKAHMPGWELDEALLAATTLNHPWSDPELPSLVAVGPEGRIIGFVAAQARRMRFGEAEIRGVCASDLIVDPEHRLGAPGVLLMSRLLAGPQDVTWSDSATDAVVRVWRKVGGGVDHARAADFMLVLHAGKWLRSIVEARVRREQSPLRLVPIRALPAGAARSWLTHREPRPAGAGVEGRDASPAEVAEHLPAISNRNLVRVDWDEEQLTHTLNLLESFVGKPTCRLVTRRGSAIGWYVYMSRPGGVSRLLHLAATERGADTVFADLVYHATETGSAVLTGRAEPHLEWPLRHGLAVLGFAWQPVIRARDPELAAALAGDSSLLTRLDGELAPY